METLDTKSERLVLSIDKNELQVLVCRRDVVFVLHCLCTQGSVGIPRLGMLRNPLHKKIQEWSSETTQCVRKQTQTDRKEDTETGICRCHFITDAFNLIDNKLEL